MIVKIIIERDLVSWLVIWKIQCNIIDLDADRIQEIVEDGIDRGIQVHTGYLMEMIEDGGT